ELIAVASDFIDTDTKKISWSRGLVADLTKGTARPFTKQSIREGAYRPFTKHWVYFDRAYNDMVYKQSVLFPTATHQNIAICTTSPDNRDSFSVVVTDRLPDLHMSDKSGASQCFPLYLYEKADESTD